MWPLGIEARTLSGNQQRRLVRVASLALAVAVVGSGVAPAYAQSLPVQHRLDAAATKVNVPVIAASTPQRPPQAEPATALTVNRVVNTTTTAELANTAGNRTTNTNPVEIANTGINSEASGSIIKSVNPPPDAYKAVTLTVTQVQPTPAIEGQPLQVSFNLTNNSSTYTLSGNVVESGNGSDLFGGDQGVNQLAPGATMSGTVSDTAPQARTGFGITLTLQGHFDDGTPGASLGGGVTCSDCSGTPTTAAASTSVDVAAAYYFELNSFAVDNTRARHLDTDYAVLSAEQEPSSLTLNANWGPQDVNNGTFNFPPLVVGPYYSVPDANNAIVANYSIVNSGHSSRDDIINAMIQAGIAGAGAAIGTFGSGSTQTNNSFGGAAGGNILGSLLNMFFANCDGVVVNDQIGPYTGGTLAAMTASGPHSEFHFYNGTDSPSGCGSNSQYWATWTLTRDNP